jgi:nitroreductase
MRQASIFLVEDEALIRMMVAEAGNIQDAQVLADRRGLPFLFISGYGSAARPEAFIERPALQKPLMLSKLGEPINAILAAAGEASSPGGKTSPKTQ